MFEVKLGIWRQTHHAIFRGVVLLKKDNGVHTGANGHRAHSADVYERRITERDADIQQTRDATPKCAGFAPRSRN